MKLNLFNLTLTLTSKINCCRSRQTIYKLCFCSQTNWKPKYRDRTKQAVKKLNLCGETLGKTLPQVKSKTSL